MFQPDTWVIQDCMFIIYIQIMIDFDFKHVGKKLTLIFYILPYVNDLSWIISQRLLIFLMMKNMVGHAMDLYWIHSGRSFIHKLTLSYMSTSYSNQMYIAVNVLHILLWFIIISQIPGVTPAPLLGWHPISDRSH